MIGILQKKQSNLVQQYGIEYELLLANDYSTEYLLIMDGGWNFTSNTSLSTMYSYLQQLPLFIGVYSDVMIGTFYKNNMSFDVNTIQFENVRSPVLIKNSKQLNMGDRQEDILKNRNLFLRIPETLFSLEYN